MEEQKEDKPLVPKQTEGQQSGARVEVQAASREEAVEKFEKARLRLMNIDRWGQYGGSASFTLTNHEGLAVLRLPRKGDYIRIDLPGPGPRVGNGYDWVRIEDIEDMVDEKKDEAVYALRVRPAPNPTRNGKEEAHFFTDSATSSFIIQRKGTTIIAEEQGRNEKPNTQVAQTVDKVRNAVVAAAASHGIAHLQWKSMLKGILENE